MSTALVSAFYDSSEVLYKNSIQQQQSMNMNNINMFNNLEFLKNRTSLSEDYKAVGTPLAFNALNNNNAPNLNNTNNNNNNIPRRHTVDSTQMLTSPNIPTPINPLTAALEMKQQQQFQAQLQAQMQRDRTLSEGENSKNQQRCLTNTSRYKTELCRPFEENGTCKYGDKCQFAHGAHELRNLARHPKYKTEYCRTFHTVGFCPYGPRCHFIHNPEEQRGSSNSPRPPPMLSPRPNNSNQLSPSSQGQQQPQQQQPTMPIIQKPQQPQQQIHLSQQRPKLNRSSYSFSEFSSNAVVPSDISPPPSMRGSPPPNIFPFSDDGTFPSPNVSPMSSMNLNNLINASRMSHNNHPFTPRFSTELTISHPNQQQQQQQPPSSLEMPSFPCLIQLESLSPQSPMQQDDVDDMNSGGGYPPTPPESVSSDVETGSDQRIRLPIFSRISDSGSDC